MPPNPSNRAGGFKNHRLIFGHLLSGREAANAAADDADFVGLDCHIGEMREQDLVVLAVLV